MFKAIAVAVVCLFAVPATAMARIEALDPSAPGSPVTVGQAIVDNPATLAGASLPERAFGGAGAPSPIGRGDKTLDPDPKVLTGFPTFGNTYGILSSGEVNTVASTLTNTSGSTGFNFTDQFPPPSPATPARGAAANDYTVLKMDVKVPALTNCLVIDYRFLSEEFPEFVGKSFNDAFIAEIDSTTWHVDAGGALVRPNDFAATPGGAPISVNGAGPAAMFAPEANGTYFDGATGLISTKTGIKAGNHSIYLSIFDATDGIYDSTAFVDHLRFISEGSKTCHPLGAPDVVPSNVFTVSSSTVKYTDHGNTAILTVNVPDTGNIVVGAGAANVSSAAIGAKKKKVTKKTKKRALVGGPTKVKIKLNAAGKRARKKAKIAVPLKITYTPDGGTSSTKKVKVKFKKRH